MRHVFLVNPAAGRCDRTAQIKRDAEAALGSRGIPFTLCVSRKPGDLTRYARDAVVSGEDTVLYACGGDGTLNEVLQGAASFTNAVLTHIPSGSGNDFVKLFDDPAAFRDLDRLLSGREVHLDLIRVKADGKSYYAANICSMGLDARIGTQIDRYRRFPGLIDHCRTDALTVTCPTPQVINLDGEAVTACRATFTLLPHNLRFLTPAGVRLLSKERKGELLGAI